MDFDLTPDQRLFEETTTRFLSDTCPLTTVRALEEDPDGFDRQWWGDAAELGWISMLAPEEAGGGSISGAGLVDLALVAFQRGRLVSPGPLVPVNVVVDALGRAGSSDPAHAELLSTLMGGAAIAAFAAEEPRRSPYEPTLRAEASGDGFTLTGVKSPVEAAVQADTYLVTAESPEGPLTVLVSGDAPGLTVSGRDSVDLVRRFGGIEFDAVPVAASAVIGRGRQAVARSVDFANALQLAETVGAMDRVFEFTMEWAFDRYTFGRPLASYQELKHRFADMKLWLEASKATVSEAVHALAADTPAAGELLSAAKSYVAAHSTELVQDCVQMHGGIGVTWEHDIHLYLRRVTVNAATYGTAAEHRRRLATMILEGV